MKLHTYLNRLNRLHQERRHERPGRGQEHPIRSQLGMTLIEIMLVLAILATVMGVLFGPTLLGMFADSKVKTTHLLTTQYAKQAYVRWTIKTGETCPSSINDLNTFLSREDAKDSYGTEMVLLCGESAPEGVEIGVLSFGKDKKRGTSDDIMSWKKPPKDG